MTLIFGGLAFDVEKYQEGIYRKEITNTDKIDTDKEKKNKKVEYEYFYIKDNRQVEGPVRERIKLLKIPPIWNKVWISSDPKSKIQVTGIDKKGLKQYIYNAEHIKESSENKFLRVYKFIKNIPLLEKAMNKDRILDYYDKNRVIVTILDIVKKLHIRVGKEIYVKRNNSYGVSSLRKHHVKLENGVLKMKFKAKSNKIASYTLKDPEILKHIEELLKIDKDNKDSKLFQYKGSYNFIGLTSTDINNYIQEYMGKEFTIKDFRSYAANYYFIKTLLKETKKNPPNKMKSINKNIKEAITQTAFHLRHTPNISKKSYILGFAIELYKTDPGYFVDSIKKTVDEVILDLVLKYANKCGKKI